MGLTGTTSLTISLEMVGVGSSCGDGLTGVCWIPSLLEGARVGLRSSRTDGLSAPAPVSSFLEVTEIGSSSSSLVDLTDLDRVSSSPTAKEASVDSSPPGRPGTTGFARSFFEAAEVNLDPGGVLLFVVEGVETGGGCAGSIGDGVGTEAWVADGWGEISGSEASAVMGAGLSSGGVGGMGSSVERV